MFNKAKPKQLELFASAPDEALDNTKYTLFLEKVSAYERNIFLGVCFLIIFIVAYALGIEKGKKITIAENKNKTYQITPANIIPAAPQSVFKKTIDPVKKESTLNENKAPALQERKIIDAGYTVQVASFRHKSSAEKEKNLLEKKGYKVYTVSKNSYIIVCVGSFEDKTKAELSRRQLKRIYGDCLVRKL